MTSLSSRRGFITVLLDLFSDLRFNQVTILWPSGKWYSHAKQLKKKKSVGNVYAMLYVVHPPPVVIHLQKLASKPYFIYQAASFQCVSEIIPKFLSLHAALYASACFTWDQPDLFSAMNARDYFGTILFVPQFVGVKKSHKVRAMS